ncbi:hypothetical protein CF642_37865 [Burkholderia pseudomallei]|nr:hypothetical protein CF642_37865 [Burkholderia pseudomallei]
MGVAAGIVVRGPRRGYVARASAGYGGPRGKIPYYKVGLQSPHSYSCSPGFTLGLRSQGASGNGIGNPYPIFKKYCGGGIGSVRGYEPS